MSSKFAFDDPQDALLALSERLHVVCETRETNDPLGRVLAMPVLADRDSPAADVSAMDGYAIRMQDLKSDVAIPISGESKAGAAPPSLQSGSVVRIFTGAIVPKEAEAVIKREDTEESETEIRFRETALKTTKSGIHIRRAGENAAVGSQVLPAATVVTPGVMAALANFGATTPTVFRSVRIAIFTTGDEVRDPREKHLEPWQLRNSNRYSVESVVRCGAPRVEIAAGEGHLPDNRGSLEFALGEAIKHCDAIVLTGGVSKGDYDYVPECIAAVGGETIFHGLPIRPGKPILGAATNEGKLILGLPGNPVSATINAHRFLLPLLRKLSGQARWCIAPPVVELEEPPAKSIPLHTMQLVERMDPGRVRLIASKGSGDLVALAKSDGYVSVTPGSTSAGPWPFFSW
ncbi:MAG: molybdopterin molybdotransferase MoeA [Planctomycetota bacterium]